VNRPPDPALISSPIAALLCGCSSSGAWQSSLIFRIVTSSLKLGVLMSKAPRPDSDHGAEIARKATEPFCHGGSKVSSRWS
jgi:hypothetical protein